MKTFEERYNFSDKGIPILVVDLRVSLFSILFKAKQYEGLWLKEDLKHFWQQKLHFPMINHPKQKFQLVVVDDTKYADGTYWRTRYLKGLPEDYPVYKGNRKPEDRPQLYYDLHEAAIEYVKENNIPYFAKLGFEADDFAGAICKAAMENENYSRPLVLYTVDSDWGQLVNDEKSILFYYSNLPVWKDKLRDEEIIRQWFLERQSLELHSVRDIVSIKAELGDKADNLDPGSPKEVIDLINPAKTLPKKYIDKINKVLNDPYVNTNPAKSVKSTIHINRRKYEFARSQEG